MPPRRNPAATPSAAANAAAAGGAQEASTPSEVARVAHDEAVKRSLRASGIKDALVARSGLKSGRAKVRLINGDLQAAFKAAGIPVGVATRCLTFQAAVEAVRHEAVKEAEEALPAIVSAVRGGWGAGSWCSACAGGRRSTAGALPASAAGWPASSRARRPLAFLPPPPCLPTAPTSALLPPHQPPAPRRRPRPPRTAPQKRRARRASPCAWWSRRRPPAAPPSPRTRPPARAPARGAETPRQGAP